jgi:rare lipoprotein A
MFFRFLLSASVSIGALAPLSAEAKSSCGLASFYGTSSDGYAWRIMANGKPMNPAAMTTAHPSLPLGSKILVRNPANGKSIRLVVTDRGPWHGNRILDLSAGAFARVADPSQGVARLCFARA